MDQRQLAYERLIAPIEAHMMRTIWGIVRDPDEAQDALQDALAVIWRRWDRLQTHPNPEALVLRMCINAAYDALRRKHRRLRWLATQDTPVNPPDPAPSALDAVGGIPYDGVAAGMRCREVTVRTHVARARAKLRALLADLMPVGRVQEKTHA
jgi:DNA-directed RNA polymerase specialized sigma24 family protein